MLADIGGRLDFLVLPRVLPLTLGPGLRGYQFVYGDRVWLFGFPPTLSFLPSGLAIVQQLTGCRHVTFDPDVMPRLYSPVVIRGEDDPDYPASSQVLAYDKVGLMFSINGHDFYRCMAAKIGELVAQMDVTSLEGYVLPDHYRLMRMAMRRVANVEDCGPGLMAGHLMTWVRVTLKDT